MRGLIPSRFTDIKILRETRATRTFSASDKYFDEPIVLVKHFRRRYFDVNRLETERVISAFVGLRHQNLSRMLDVGLTGDGDLYVVREYFPAIASPEPLTFDAVTKLISIVRFLHSNRQVHGAIKPSNVFFSETTFKVSDPRMWKPKTVAESEEDIRFTAPEILNGATPTCESDLYSVGALLYRWIVGQDPFDDSEINQLKLKYLWASPQPITEKSSVLHHVSDAVLDLLQKDPKKRPPAFDVVLNALQVKTSAATRAAFVGRNEVLERVQKSILKEHKRSLSTIVIEGPAGIGKSRLIEQLRINCLFDSVDFGICECNDSLALEAVTSAILDLLRWRQPKKALSVELITDAAGKALGAFNVSECESTNSIPNYPIERSISDLVGSIGILARASKLAFVIEDVDRSSPTMLKFIEQLCFRAAELPLTLVITCRERL
jgi:serine/threonine protein kinase